MPISKIIYFSRECLSIKLLGVIVVAAFILGVMTPPEANAWWDAKWQQEANIKENLTDSTIRSLCGNQTPENPVLEHYPVPVRPVAVLVPVHPVPVRPVPPPPVPVRPLPLPRR